MDNLKMKRLGQDGWSWVGSRLACLHGMRAWVAGMLLFSQAGHSSAQTVSAPDLLPFQGTLVNGDGGALGKLNPQNYDVVFRIYDAPSGGTLLWAEQQTVTVDAGRFSVQLGQGGVSGTEPRPSLTSVFRLNTASDRYLETTVNAVGPGKADSTLSPRTRLLPGPYALVSRHARTAERIVNSARTGVITIRGAQVGINTTNPASALEVVGSTLAESLQLNGNGWIQGAATAGGWVGGGAAPVGSIILWSGTAVDKPEGWAFCDGTVVNGYPTPDLRGRFVLGAGEGPGLTERKVGGTGGEEMHTLVAAEMPTHGHSMTLSIQSQSTGGHTHSLWSEVGSNVEEYGNNYQFGRSDWNDYELRWNLTAPWVNWAAGDQVSVDRFSLQTTAAGGHTHSLDLPETLSAAAGGGGAHPNMPPFYVLAYLVRVK